MHLLRQCNVFADQRPEYSKSGGVHFFGRDVRVRSLQYTWNLSIMNFISFRLVDHWLKVPHSPACRFRSCCRRCHSQIAKKQCKTCRQHQGLGKTAQSSERRFLGDKRYQFPAISNQAILFSKHRQ